MSVSLPPNNPALYFSGLKKSQSGCWVTIESVSPVSFPSLGHRELLEVEEKSFWFRFRNRYIVQILQRFSFPPTVFDVGGGNGFVSKALAAHGFRPILVEPGEGAEFAAQSGQAAVVRARVQDLVSLKPMEAVGLFDVLEHLEEDVQFLQTLRRMSAPSSLLAITVPAFGFLWSKDDVYAGHFRRYSRSDLTKTLQAAGYEPLFCSYIFSYLWLPLFLIRTLPSWLGTRGDKVDVKSKEDHQRQGALSRLAVALFSLMTRLELGLLRRGLVLPFGTSLICVAQNTTSQCDTDT